MNENYPQNISSKHLDTVASYLEFERKFIPHIYDEVQIMNILETRFFFNMSYFHLWIDSEGGKLEEDLDRQFANSTGPALSDLTQALAQILMSTVENEKDLNLVLGFLVRIVQLARIAGAVAYSDLIRLEGFPSDLAA